MVKPIFYVSSEIGWMMSRINDMSRIPVLEGRLRLPLIAAPLFIISQPKLVIAQCKSGVVGSFPALNARPDSMLDEWLAEITEALAAHDSANPDQPSAPFAVNQIVHRSNQRLDRDLEVCVKHKVPLIITSLGARAHRAVQGAQKHRHHRCASPQPIRQDPAQGSARALLGRL